MSNDFIFSDPALPFVDRKEVVIGIDEVGRGACFGPLVVCACTRLVGWWSRDVRDSKKIHSENTRYRIADDIRSNTVFVIVEADHEAIERNGIEKCVKELGERAREELISKVIKVVPDARIQVVYDGNDFANKEIITIQERPVLIRCFPKADAKVFEVSAASIIAKAHRDAMMRQMVIDHPELDKYDIANSKGYGTPKHAQAIIDHGVTQWHRQQFCKSLVRSFTKPKPVPVPTIDFDALRTTADPS